MLRPTIFVKKTKELIKKLKSKKEIIEINPEEVKKNGTDK